MFLENLFKAISFENFTNKLEVAAIFQGIFGGVAGILGAIFHFTK